MTSQLYLTGHLAGNPELLETKKGKLFVKLVLETSFAREVRPGEVQTESVTLPITLYAQPALQVEGLHEGDQLTVGAHLYGTEFKTPEGKIKRGIQIVADQVFLS